MNQRQKKVLNQFDPSIRNHILEFCKKISSIECDVFVLLARKAACFISILEDCDLLVLNGKVVSERVLDYKTDWLKNKNIVIIDDTVISGTSIHQIVKSLLNIGVNKVRVQVFCINTYWFVDDLLLDQDDQSYLDKPYISLEHTASLKFCQDIVKVLSIYPRPYSTDFPIFESIKFRELQLKKLQEIPNWKIIDTTSDLQSVNSIQCFSMNPEASILTEFYDQLGVSLQKYSFLKVRVYAQRFVGAENKPYYLCRVLPLVIFNPVSIDFLDKMISTICLAENTEYNYVNAQLNTSKSKLRFVQFYFAHRFFLFFLSKFEAYFNKNFTFVSNSREVELIFPPKLVQIIKRFSHQQQLTFDNLDVINEFLVTQHLEISQNNVINPFLIKATLLKKFLELYYQKELVARRIVKKIKAKAFSDEIYTKVINRLNEGFTFGELKVVIQQEVYSSTDQNILLSNFLDNGIDSGIIVPVTQESNGYVSRAYRHGEEVPWGENNDLLLGYFFEKYLSIVKKGTMSDFEFQKMMVLFIKLGLRRGILEEYNMLTPPPQKISLIGVRSYLFGQVTIIYELKPFSETKFNPILDYDVKGYWTSQKLLDIGVLSKDNDGKYVFDFETLRGVPPLGDCADDEPIDLADDLIESVEEIAELLAIARNNKLLTNDGLVYLTSCLTIHDCIASIAGEAYIFTQSINQAINLIRSVYSGHFLNIKFLASLRDYSKNHAWTAVNSGREKYKDYKEGAGQKLIQSITNYFDNEGSFKKRAWSKLWKREIDINKNEAPDLYKLNDDFGILLTELNIVMIYVHQLLYEFCRRTNELNMFFDQKYRELNSIESKIKLITDQINTLQEDAKNKNQFEIDFINSTIIGNLDKEKKSLVAQSKSSKDNIDYWSNFCQNDLSRLKEYVADYRSIDKDVLPLAVNEAITNLSTGLLQIFTQDVLKEELNKYLKLLINYKDKSVDLLEDFSLLVPQWGKINPIVRYDCIIHVNTKAELAEDRQKLANIVKKVLAGLVHEEGDAEDHFTRSVVLLRPKFQKKNMGYFIASKSRLRSTHMAKLAGRLLKACFELQYNYQIIFYPILENKREISAFYNDKSKIYDEVHEDFSDYFNSLESQCLNIHNCLLIFRGIDTLDEQHYKKIIQENTQSKVDVDLLYYRSISGHDHNLYQYNYSKEPMKKNTKIGVITALPKEFAAMRCMLDTVNENFEKPSGDVNDYIQGTIVNKRGTDIDVVVVLAKSMGNNMASGAATNLIRSFPEIEDVIMVGIAGGIPNISNPDSHVRLGDVVVTNRKGIIQYDNVKESTSTVTVRSNSSIPSARLIGLCNLLEVERFSLNTPWNNYISQKSSKLHKAHRPSGDKDILKVNGVVVDHPVDNERIDGLPKIHFGAIGSANNLLKNEGKRDYLRDNFDVKAIEMEGSGIADGTWQFSKGYLVVRGIVDYCNDDKDDQWHTYGALCAAAYAKSIITFL